MHQYKKIKVIRCRQPEKLGFPSILPIKRIRVTQSNTPKKKKKTSRDCNALILPVDT